MFVAGFESCVPRSDFSVKRLLEAEFCSLEWVALSHVQRRDAQGRIIVCRKRGAYPVAGMIRCAECGRFAPADLGRQVCVDCRVEIDVRRFSKRLANLDRDDHVVLLALSWRRPPWAHDWLKEGMPVAQAGLDEGLLTDAHEQDGESSIDEADLFDGQLASDQTWGPGPSLRELRAQLRRRFLERYTTRKGRQRVRVKRHGAGCRMVLLTEASEALQKEIAYYEAKGIIHPSARRVSNPHDWRERPLPMPGRRRGR